MASDVTVTFGADAGDLLQALQQIDANLKQTIAGFGGLAQAKTGLDTVSKATKEWEQALRPVDRAFSQSMTGIVRGTMTAQQAIRRFSQSMVTSLIDDAEKSTMHWLASELAKTTATQIGTEARSAADSQGQTTGLIKLIDLTLKAIGIDAAKTFADVFAFFAPDMGPAAAAPAGASAAAVSAGAFGLLPHLAVGAWDVPQDMPAFIHRGETVLPVDFATGLRNAAGGGRGGVSSSAQISIHAMDGGSVKRVLGANHGAVASAMRKAWRHGSGGLR